MKNSAPPCTMVFQTPGIRFTPGQIGVVNESVLTSEDLVCNFYKMSKTEWARLRYDVKTVDELNPHEILQGPFAQVIRYEAKRKEACLGSSAFDLYKICLQDHSIIEALNIHADIQLYPFMLYIVVHELIHIVRFSRFLQNFDASPEKKQEEENRVHQYTHEILEDLQLSGIKDVLSFYRQWRMSAENPWSLP
jgi:hypothetical protein